MFIKKDERKLQQIFDDEEDKREELKLARRQAEFGGNTRVLLSSANVERMENTKVLSLYHNRLKKITHIGRLEACALLEEINLGRNLLDRIPPEFAKLSTLKRVWLDDNLLTEFPEALLHLEHLEELRLSGNKIKDLPRKISVWSKLRVLSVDNNELSEIPDTIETLVDLETLYLRGNRIAVLPDGIGALSKLTMLNVSSNDLVALPDSLASCTSLTRLFANGNNLVTLPACLAGLTSLEVVNVANNSIETLPRIIIKSWSRVVKELSVAAAGPGVEVRGSGAGGEEGDAEMEGEDASAGRAARSRGDLLSFGEDSFDDGDLSLRLRIDGNPIVASLGAGLAESQFTQPLTADWATKA